MTHRLSIPLVLVLALVVPMPAFASNEALLKLLQVLRDRGSISAEEYEEIRRTAEEPAAVVSPLATPSETPQPTASPAIYTPSQPGLMRAVYHTTPSDSSLASPAASSLPRR